MCNKYVSKTPKKFIYCFCQEQIQNIILRDLNWDEKVLITKTRVQTLKKTLVCKKNFFYVFNKQRTYSG